MTSAVFLPFLSLEDHAEVEEEDGDVPMDQERKSEAPLLAFNHKINCLVGNLKLGGT